MHSTNVDHMTAFARAVQTTIFVKNGPSYAGIGLGGEGHTSFTIAGPTGEGLTSARTFTRQRRCTLVESFRSFDFDRQPLFVTLCCRLQPLAYSL